MMVWTDDSLSAAAAVLACGSAHVGSSLLRTSPPMPRERRSGVRLRRDAHTCAAWHGRGTPGGADRGRAQSGPRGVRKWSARSPEPGVRVRLGVAPTVYFPFPSAVRAELEVLGTRCGVPRTHIVRLGANRFLASAAATRTGEVCMVIRVASDGVLAVTKEYYPPNVYRLPTGGIRRGEPVLDALRREVREETGLDSSIVTFLAIIGYHDGGTLSEFFTWVFLLDGTDEPRPEDPEERIAGFRVVARGELPAIAAQLEGLPDDFSQEFERSWAEWGRFRGAAHRVVWEALTGAGR